MQSEINTDIQSVSHFTCQLAQITKNTTGVDRVMILSIIWWNWRKKNCWQRARRALTLLIWEPEERYRHRLYTAIAPFWFLMGCLQTALMPFWLSTERNNCSSITLIDLNHVHFLHLPQLQICWHFTAKQFHVLYAIKVWILFASSLKHQIISHFVHIFTRFRPHLSFKTNKKKKKKSQGL